MKTATWITALLCGTVGIATAALAHPDTAFDSRGKCESALAHTNTEDRKFVVAEGLASASEANRYFHEVFECRKIGDKWFIIFVGE